MEEKKKKSFKEWIKEHKKALVAAGISITSIIAFILTCKNWDSILDLWDELQTIIDKDKVPVPVIDEIAEVAAIKVPTIEMQQIGSVSQDAIERLPFEVRKHIRNLPEGWVASSEKITTAAENGYNLMPGQTWIKAYMKGGMVA